LIRLTDAATNEVVYALDKSGLVTKVTSNEKESGATFTYVVEYEYNADRHLVAVKEKGDGNDGPHTTSYQVDKLGRTTKIVDANSNEVCYDFDNWGRVTRTRRGAGGSYVTMLTAFDLNDNVVTETVSGNSTTYEYDNADRMITMNDESDTPVKILAYDDAHNVVNRTDGNGSVASMSYDDRNLVTRIDYTLAANVVGPTMVKFAYDGMGRMSVAAGWGGVPGPALLVAPLFWP
jgi:YD repeat-containing protein